MFLLSRVMPAGEGLCSSPSRGSLKDTAPSATRFRNGGASVDDAAATPCSPIDQFHRLHASGCFVLPNPWDVGTALYLQHLGFAALATTSAGFAFTRGLPDT